MAGFCYRDSEVRLPPPQPRSPVSAIARRGRAADTPRCVLRGVASAPDRKLRKMSAPCATAHLMLTLRDSQLPLHYIFTKGRSRAMFGGGCCIRNGSHSPLGCGPYRSPSRALRPPTHHTFTPPLP